MAFIKKMFGNNDEVSSSRVNFFIVLVFVLVSMGISLAKTGMTQEWIGLAEWLLCAVAGSKGLKDITAAMGKKGSE